jgi:hypothetical protein
VTGVDLIGLALLAAEVLGIFVAFSIATRYIEAKGKQANG